MKKAALILAGIIFITATFSCKKKKDDVATPVSTPQASFTYKVNGTARVSGFSFAQVDSSGTQLYGTDHLASSQTVPPAISVQLPGSAVGTYSLDSYNAAWIQNDTTQYISYHGTLNITSSGSKLAGTFSFDAVSFSSSAVDTVHITDGVFSDVNVYHN